MSAALITMFGEELATQSGTVKTSEALAGKTVALYFSAHWCPPCRGFTPKLAEAYTSDLSAKGLEVVFISSDKDQASFDEYFGTMPWLALPFSARDTQAALSNKFKVQGIPTLAIVDADGVLINSDGVAAVSSDPTGDEFPWKPPTFAEALGETFIGQGGATLDKSAVEGKVLGIYFSAHWCPPCRKFTPQLAEWYKKVSPTLPDFEIVFASSDSDQDSFEEYFGEMPWIALPFAERKRKQQLSSMFDVNGIPAFVIVDKDGSTITKSGRGIPVSDPDGTQFPWVPPALKDLTDTDDINETPCLVVMMEDADEAEQESIRAALLPIAEEYTAKAKLTGVKEMVVFAAGPKVRDTIQAIRRMIGTAGPIVKHEHPLTHAPDRTNWYCDGCSKSDESGPWNCEKCDFDFCQACHEAAIDAADAPKKSVDVVLLDVDFTDQGGYYKGEGVDLTTAGFRDFITQWYQDSV